MVLTAVRRLLHWAAMRLGAQCKTCDAEAPDAFRLEGGWLWLPQRDIWGITGVLDWTHQGCPSLHLVLLLAVRLIVHPSRSSPWRLCPQ